ncbi:MAG: hypothetical protein IJ725_03630 [Ruminococcus sp.]|nr:hypothetical protein [Ruminococcus sp.]
MKKKRLLLPMIVFLLFIFLMTVLFIVTPKSDYSSLEKRYLEDFPEAKLEAIANGEFEEGFENYFADHFPIRNMWVGLNAYSNFIIGNNGSNGVYNADEGYLINEPVSDENRIDTNLKALTDFSEKTDVRMTFLLAPSTGYIMKDTLPLVHNEYKDDEYFNNVKSALSGTGIDFVDIRSRFKSDAQSGTQLYYRTDHHWTTEGAYTAYNQLMRALGNEPAKKSIFKVESYPDFYGTTYSTSGFWFNMGDEIELWQNPKNDKKITLEITEGSESKTYDTMYFTKHLDEDDKYPVFIDGNHALETITNKNVKSGKALVIKDSFAHSMAPFLAENYNEVTLVDLRYYKNSISELVKKEKYDDILVIYGIDNFATDTDLVWLN